MIYGSSINLLESSSLSNIEISAEQIKEFCKLIPTDNILFEKKMEEEEFAASICKKLNFTPKHFKMISDAADEMVEIIQKFGISKKTISAIEMKAHDIVYRINTDLNHLFPKNDIKFAGLDLQNVNKSTTLTFFVVILNTLVLNIFWLLFRNKKLAQILTIGIICPVIEESAKRIAIKGGYAKEFTIVFNTIEFSSYVTQYCLTLGLGKIIAIRLLPVGMHLTTTLIHWLGENKEVQKCLGIENSKEEKQKLSTLAGICGCLVHMIWNLVATIAG